VSSFLSLSVSIVANLPFEVLKSIAEQATQFEEFKSQKVIDEVSYGKLNKVMICSRTTI
jgi:hypothetical protein